MPTLNIDDRLAFIRQSDLRLPPSVSAPPQDWRSIHTAGDATLPAAYVAASSINVCTANVSPAHQTAALLTTLFGILYANAQVDRSQESAIPAWYDAFLVALSDLGWTTGAMPFAPYQPPQAEFTISSAVLSGLPSWMSSDQVSIASAGLTALAKPANMSLYTVWDHCSYAAPVGNFQLCAVSDDNGASNSAVMTIAGYYFSTPAPAKDFLWTKYQSAAVTLSYGHQALTLNDEVYAALEAAIKQKLGSAIHRLIGQLTLPA